MLPAASPGGLEPWAPTLPAAPLAAAQGLLFSLLPREMRSTEGSEQQASSQKENLHCCQHLHPELMLRGRPLPVPPARLLWHPTRVFCPYPKSPPSRAVPHMAGEVPTPLGTRSLGV